jgi:hypothetical protein
MGACVCTTDCDHPPFFPYNGFKRVQPPEHSWMKDAFEVLQQKEVDLARVQQEVESLRIVAPLLAEEGLAPVNHDPVVNDNKK